ncbi:MAG: hypothetical protein HQL60_02385 [Magnetococcales bacterium]|nr:hypothetical protein [Magnetococcales bacterium]
MTQVVLRNPVGLPTGLPESGLTPHHQSDAWTQSMQRRALLCVRCQWPITDAAQRIAVAGDHEHTVFNPHGVVFHIGCFGVASGCVGVGEWSGEFSWFRGHVWQIALCGRCQWHLGWFFREQLGAVFVGLILNRLLENKEQQL